MCPFLQVSLHFRRFYIGRNWRRPLEEIRHTYFWANWQRRKFRPKTQGASKRVSKRRKEVQLPTWPPAWLYFAYHWLIRHEHLKLNATNILQVNSRKGATRLRRSPRQLLHLRSMWSSRERSVHILHETGLQQPESPHLLGLELQLGCSCSPQAASRTHLLFSAAQLISELQLASCRWRRAAQHSWSVCDCARDDLNQKSVEALERMLAISTE